MIPSLQTSDELSLANLFISPKKVQQEYVKVQRYEKPDSFLINYSITSTYDNMYS